MKKRESYHNREEKSLKYFFHIFLFNSHTPYIFCHSRESGNPDPPMYLEENLDSRFRGNDIVRYFATLTRAGRNTRP